MAAALTEASAQGCFGAQNPGAPLPLRASMEAVDAVAVVGGEAVEPSGGYGAQTASETEAGRKRRLEGAIDIVPHATGVEADIGAGPIVVHHRRRGCRDPHVRRHCRPCEHRRKRHASKQELLHLNPPLRNLSWALLTGSRRFGCDICATVRGIRNLITTRLLNFCAKKRTRSRTNNRVRCRPQRALTPIDVLTAIARRVDCRDSASCGLREELPGGLRACARRDRAQSR